MTETEEKLKETEPIMKGSSELDQEELHSLKEELKIIQGQMRSLEYTSNLEREAFKRELSGAYDEINMLRRETSANRSLKGKRKKAAWDNDYLLKVLTG